MAPKTCSTLTPARKVSPNHLHIGTFLIERTNNTQAAEPKTATSALVGSQTLDDDLKETTDLPTKRPRISRKNETRALIMETDVSRQAVLNTSELLEGILAFLPPKQLFANQRVCKQWRNVIASSPELQRKMFLRVDEVPRQTWGLKIEISGADHKILSELRRFDNCLPSRVWTPVTPATLSPHLKINNNDYGWGPGSPEILKHWVAFDLPCSLIIGSRASILDTYICNPPCHEFQFYLEFKFEPAIPRYRCLNVSGVRFKTSRALKYGEALDRAIAIRTNAVLREDFRSETFDIRQYKNVTVTEIIDELQRKYKCTAILSEKSVLMLNNTMVSNQQQWAEVNAAYARTMQRTE